MIPDDVKRAIGFEPLPDGRDLKGKDGNERERERERYVHNGPGYERRKRLRESREISRDLQIGFKSDASQRTKGREIEGWMDGGYEGRTTGCEFDCAAEANLKLRRVIS